MAKIKVAFIGTFLPRQCGIATFTTDLRSSVESATSDAIQHVVAMNNVRNEYDYDERVVFTIRKDIIEDYIRAAEYLNFSDLTSISLQHEFGIYGGDCGDYILTFLKSTRVPVVTTLHTVLEKPDEKQRNVMRNIFNYSQKVIVMAKKAIEMLDKNYDLRGDKIELVYHGVPDVDLALDNEKYKKIFQVEGNTVLGTFGLISENKGLEYSIRALSPVVKRFPNIKYIILGQTHPEVKKKEGQKYRIFLQQIVKDLHLEKHVIFVDQFVILEKLKDFLMATDIYLTPYLSEEQITSGTLAYAFAAGKAVISTPYWHAKELLEDKKGILVPFRDSESISNALMSLLENQDELINFRKKAYSFGRQMIWKEVGKKYYDIFRDISKNYKFFVPEEKAEVTSTTLPKSDLTYLLTLTDGTGIIQHAKYGIPNRFTGYTMDDMARGLIVASKYYDSFHDKESLCLLYKCLSFIQYGQRDDGSFHNYMNFEKKFTDKTGSEDTFGMTLWGLGVAMRLAPNEEIRIFAREIFDKAVPNLNKINSPRAMAYSILGLYCYLRGYGGAVDIRKYITKFADKLCELFENVSDSKWKWFEDIIAYGNAIFPHALFLGYDETKNEKYLKIALESIDFLSEVCFKDGYLKLIGADGWYRKGGDPAKFGEQPIDAAYMVPAYFHAYELTKDEKYKKFMEDSFAWFLGKNCINIPVYNFSTKGCYDGIEREGLNLNQGAESTICYLNAFLTVYKISHGVDHSELKVA